MLGEDVSRYVLQYLRLVVALTFETETAAEYDLTEEQGAYTMGTMFAAGAHTAAAAMKSFLLAMVLHPSTFKTLQVEIDGVVGDRPPDISDLPRLPCLRAAIKETLRWRPLPPNGVAHKSTKDDIYGDFFIPAGTIVQPSSWAIHRDEAVYPRPDEFLPERWLDPAYPATYREPLTEYPTIKNYSAFGFGRRICPGFNIMEKSLTIQAACIAWACNISKRVDQDGGTIEVPADAYKNAYTTEPEWFPFDLKVRSSERQEVVDMMLARTQNEDPLKDR